MHRSSHFLPLLTLAAIAATAGACAQSGNDNARSDSSAAATPAASAHDTSMAGRAHRANGIADMSGNPDRDFLRMMSDHHQSLIALAHAAIARKDASAAVRDEARAVDTKQDAELDTMTTMLLRAFNERYTPKPMPTDMAMNDSALLKYGSAFDRAFRETVIKHYHEGIKLMDQYLPRLTEPTLKTLVQRMRAEQTRAITDLSKR